MVLTSILISLLLHLYVLVYFTISVVSLFQLFQKPIFKQKMKRQTVARTAFFVYCISVSLCLPIIVYLSCLFQGSLTRFTWWAILIQLIFGGFILLNQEWRIYPFVFTIQTIVLLGVLIMSSQDCGTFKDALDTEGPIVYFYGTWILHYAPIVVTAAAYTPEWRETSVVMHILLGLGVFCIYSIFQNPVVTYGCSDLNESVPVLAASGYGISLIILYSILYWEDTLLFMFCGARHLV